MSITQRLRQIYQIIQDTANQCARNPQDIRLIGVTKGQSIKSLLEAYNAGLTEFAESYWQEAQTKLVQLSDLPITWHFIGPLQSNKTPAIANHFSWIHSVSRDKIARLLAYHRNPNLPPLNICIQVNLDATPNKSGVDLSEAQNLAKLIQDLPNLKLRGLMAIPEPRDNEHDQYISFLRLTRLFNELNDSLHHQLDTLSMGMSHDFIAAIHARSTMIRLGEAIFGSRQNK